MLFQLFARQFVAVKWNSIAFFFTFFNFQHTLHVLYVYGQRSADVDCRFADFMPINKLPMAHRTTLVLWITINQHGIKLNQIKSELQ